MLTLSRCFSSISGLDQFLRDAKLMLGFTPGIYWRICWKFISPVFLMVCHCLYVILTNLYYITVDLIAATPLNQGSSLFMKTQLSITT